MRRVAICCAVLALSSATALAAESQLDAAQRCTRITDSLERLVCYDKAMAPGAAPAAPAASRAQVAAAPPELGQEQLKQSGSKAEGKASTLDAKISTLDSLPWDMVRMTLDNGQVWQQQESSARFSVKVGDTVRIKKGALGSYRMSRISNGTSGWVQVRRIE